jgi:hypothetical protein
MISTSAGSQPKGKEFLDGYVEKAIQALQEERMPSGFQRLAQGEEASDVRTKALNREIVV